MPDFSSVKAFFDRAVAVVAANKVVTAVIFATGFILGSCVG